MTYGRIILCVAALFAGCTDASTGPPAGPSVRGTITATAPQQTSGSPDAIQTIVVQPLTRDWSVGSLARCYRDAVLTISDETRVRRPGGEVVGRNVLSVGQLVSVWTEPTFPVTSSCRPGAVAADVLIESSNAP
jgi:hypothetical protein